MKRIAPFLVAVAVLGTCAFLFVASARDGYIVRAELPNAGGLRKNSSVKIAGVPGGKVKDIEITSRDTALATLELGEEAAPIGAGATIQIRPTDLLGERYADMDAGDRRRPQPSGSLIPLKRTSVPVELDDILNMLDSDTRARVRILVNEFGIALDGRGDDFQRLLAELPPGLDKAQALLADVSADNLAIKRLIEQGDRITASVSSRRDDLGELIAQASGALRTVARRRAALGATVANAPAALSELRTTLDRLGDASDDLRPAAIDLRRVAPPLASTLRALPSFAASARGTLAKARAIAPDLSRLGSQARPAVRRLRPSASLLRDVAQDAKPGLEMLDRRGMEDILRFAQNWSLAMKGRDSLGHFVGAQVVVNAQTLTNAVNAYLGEKPVRKKAPRKRPRLPELPKLPEVKAPKAPALPGVRTPKLPKVPKVPSVELPKTPSIDDAVKPPALPDALRDAAGVKSPVSRSQDGSALRLFDYLFAP